MKAKIAIPFVLAIIFGFAAAKVGRDVLRSKFSKSNNQLVTTVSAATDLEAGRMLSPSDLTTTPLPPESVTPLVVREPAEIIGRVLVAPVAKGQSILTSALAPEGSGAGVQALVPSGMRAVTIEVNEFSGMDGLLMPGCQVDVVATLQDEQTRQSISRTILEDVKVLAVGVQTAPKPPQKELTGVRTTAKGVTLVVTPREAETLDLMASKGRPRLVLRSRVDKATVATGGVTMAELMRNGSEKGSLFFRRMASSLENLVVQPATRPILASEQPAPAPVEVKRSVQIIKGGKETTKSFEVMTPGAAGAEVAEAFGSAKPDRAEPTR